MQIILTKEKGFDKSHSPCMAWYSLDFHIFLPHCSYELYSNIEAKV